MKEKAKERAKPRAWLGPWLRLVPLMALWAVPVVAVAIAVPAASLREHASVAPPLPSVVVVGSQSTDYRKSVTATVEVQNIGQVRSPVSGLVTSLATIEGPVRAGQELFAVDGVPVLAQPGSSPLHRELRTGDQGEDVGVLSRFLIDAGLLAEEPETEIYGYGLQNAVERLQDRLGIAIDGVFRPSYVTFLPVVATELGKPQISVGSSISAGAVILDIVPIPAAIRFSSTNNGSSLGHLQGGPLSLSFGELHIPVTGLEPTPDEIAVVYAGLRQAVAAGTAQVTIDESTGSEQHTGGLLSLANAQTRGVVPGTAVYLARTGAACLFRQQPDAAGWEAVRLPTLEAAVGTMGTIYVEAELIDARIVRDPLILTNDVLIGCR